MQNNNSDNILLIDNKIRENFKKSKEDLYIKLKKIRNVLKDVEKLNKETIDILKKNVIDIEKQIKDQENNENYKFYILETLTIIEEYKKILKEPIRTSFLGKTNVNNMNDRKQKLVKDYMNISKIYIPNGVKYTELYDNICSNCKSSSFELIEDYVYICSECFCVQTFKNTVNSWFSDITRINISNKYSYDRKSHFKECLDQYHGKQNVDIKKEVYDKIVKQLEIHNLLLGDSKVQKKTRFKNISKKTILRFLKELNLTKHYENVNLIHSNITGQELDDISDIREQILLDFDKLSEIYDIKFADINRKNFINTQYVLFQLLIKHNHKCSIEDFTNLKTTDRKFFHDRVLKVLFEELGWNYTSIF